MGVLGRPLEADIVTFVGGAVVGLLLTDPAAPEARVTDDVDVLISETSRAGYYRIEERLRDAGYSQPGDGPICRCNIAGTIVDLMPVDMEVLVPGKLILGSLGDIETGIRQTIRTRPLEIAEVSLPSGEVLRIPTADETLRIKAFIIVRRNQTRDFLDVAALAHSMGIHHAAEVLSGIEASGEAP